MLDCLDAQKKGRLPNRKAGLFCLLSLVLAVCGNKDVRQKHNQTQKGNGQQNGCCGLTYVHGMSAFFHMTEF